ncbi:hypothetical protein LS684_11820 [Cytobacillus spongiae]|uniref:hypothetical protein n=1 Tax=Cytobacillus spongiae TaxID=2901381 RepID=UPI001F1F24ED|nr:hypothetical protein [Cytobacillus spongiae]UII54369.1 hypothetical protein LS684_11820 [Cytobacillus spongiae]
MEGVCLINERFPVNGLSNEESTQLQLNHCLQFMRDKSIEVVPLNKQQIYPHYSIPHALLYDLSKSNRELDYLVIYSDRMLQEFIHVYPAKWVMLKSFFREVVVINKEQSISINIH